MLLSGLNLRRTLVGVMGTGALAGAMLFGGASSASAEPPPPPAPPGCSAGDLAQVSGTVGTAMADYLFTHPDVNDFFTSLRGLPNEELRGDVRELHGRPSPGRVGDHRDSPTPDRLENSL